MRRSFFFSTILVILIGGGVLLNLARVIAQNPFPATAVTVYTSTSPYATAPLNAFATNNCNTGSQDLRGQCTWYVNARLQELKASGHLVASSVNNIQTALCNATGRHAKNWDNIIGGTWHSTSSTIALPVSLRNPGLIVVWDDDPSNSNGGLYGHVAFVEEVNANKTQYRISEFNWCTGNCRLYNGGNTWLPFDGNDSRLGVYPKFYVVGLPLPTATPVTNAPTGSNIQIPVNFSWGSVVGTGVEYRIQVSTTNSGWTSQNGFSSSASCGSTLVVNRNTGSTSSFSWSGVTTGVCFAPQPGTTYFWTVKAYSPGGGNSLYSPVKSFTTASNITVTLPTSVNASDGSYSDRVRVTWSGTSGNYFRVYRNTANNSATSTALGSWQTSTTYDDFSAVAGTTYYYWVRAASNNSGSNASTYSNANTGYRATTITVTTPTSVNASDGAYTDRVRVTFSGTSGNYFRVYRNTSNNSATSAALGSWQTSTTYDDFSAVTGTTYYYWVRAASNSTGSNASTYSNSNTGYRAVSGPAAPANDNPCSATTITAGSSCSNTSGTTVGATNTTNPGAPTSCPFFGKDVWYKVQVPSSGIVTIRTTAGTLNDLIMAIYSGSCSALQGIVCEDDNTNGNGSYMPVITITGYSPGTWLHIRVWGYNGATGTFSICALNYSTVNLVAPDSDIIDTQYEPLTAVFPNPSEGDLTLEYSLIEPSLVQVEVFDLTGKTVLKLPEEQAHASNFTQSINLRTLPGGAYFLKTKINGRVFTEKILLTRY